MNLKNNTTTKLFEAILTLKDIDECYKFFEDICTIKELEDLSSRFTVACMLSDKMSYQKITNETGVSSATIGRVNRALLYGSDGYKIAIERLNKNKEKED